MRPYPKTESVEPAGPRAIDYVVTALSPALIMGLVGSLVFFLAEVFYAGRYEARLLHTLFCYVVGIVLVARISIVVDPTRAALYGVVLAGASFIAIKAYVNFSTDTFAGKAADFINIGLLAIVWWCANKLVKDCTEIDEGRTSSGKGLLAAVGFERQKFVEKVEEEAEDEPEKKPHTPGTTVVFFSLAALPIFGLGESLIPATDSARRSYTFQLAAVYVGCALGLLLTTSFLGVRRYLRQRDLKMPGSMTAVWLGMGALLIASFVVVAAVLPRPYSETPVIRMKAATSKERNASQNAQFKDGEAGKGEGRAGNQTKAGDGKATAKEGKKGGDGKDGKSKDGSGDKEGKDGNASKDGKGKEGGESKDSKGDAKKNGEEKSGERKDAKNQEQGDQPQSKSESQQQDSMEKFQQSSLGQVVNKIGELLKWILFAVVAGIFLFVLFLVLLKNFAPASKWAQALLAKWQAFLARLFGRGPKGVTVEKEEEIEEPRPRFVDFSNPFDDGTAGLKKVPTLIRYSFAALEAWAGDRGAPRTPDETPLEFAARLQEQFAGIEPQAQHLAVLLARLEYAEGELPTNTREALKRVWEEMESGGREPRRD